MRQGLNNGTIGNPAHPQTDSSPSMSNSSSSLSPRSASVALFGAFVRSLGNWIAVADLVVLLNELAIDEQSARSAIARLKRTRLLESHRHFASAGYSAGVELLGALTDGDARIFHSQVAADLADGWVLVVFSVPEAQRDRRHQLRTRLAALGCGPLSPGVWIAPRRVAPDIRRILLRTDLARYSSMFEGTYEGFIDLDTLVGTTWNVASHGRRYDAFTKQHERLLARWDRHDAGATAAFVDYVGMVEAWRRLVYQDPGLPDEVSAGAAQRHAAHQVFTRGVAMLGPAATAHVIETMGSRRLDAGPVSSHPG
jgi:phenylacetic acid degradation operon negative regulatory protein